MAPAIPSTARVLEIGCAEFEWIRHARESWPKMTIHGIDWRTCGKDPLIVRGDVLRHNYDVGIFDWIVLLSALEHIGLGHYDSDPVAEDGDTQTMARAWDWLAPGGTVYVDVPFSHEGYQVCGTSHRMYDEAAVQARVLARPWVVDWRGFSPWPGYRQLTTPGSTGRYIAAFWLRKPLEC